MPVDEKPWLRLLTVAIECLKADMNLHITLMDGPGE